MITKVPWSTYRCKTSVAMDTAMCLLCHPWEWWTAPVLWTAAPSGQEMAGSLHMLYYFVDLRHSQIVYRADLFVGCRHCRWGSCYDGSRVQDSYHRWKWIRLMSWYARQLLAAAALAEEQMLIPPLVSGRVLSSDAQSTYTLSRMGGEDRATLA